MPESYLIFLKFFGIILCLISVAFYAGIETALTSLRRTQAKRLLIKGDIPLLKLWLENPDRILTELLLGSTALVILSTLLCGSVSKDLALLKGWDSKNTAFYLTFLFLLILLLFGEITPKGIAKKAPESFAKKFLFILVPMEKILKRPVWILKRFTDSLLTIFRLKPDTGWPAASLGEIEYLLERGTKEGALDQKEQMMIEGLLDFGQTRVKDIMLPRPEIDAVNLHKQEEKIIAQIIKLKHSRIPAYRGNLDNPVGIIYAKELLNALRDKELITIDDILRPAYFVPETKRISELLREFKEGKMHMALAVDEYGIVVGLVTIEDIVEEIVGEIWDEYDKEEITIEPLGREAKQEWSILAKEDLDKINEKLGLELPSEEFDSLGGFIIDLFGKVPRSGESIVYQNTIFTIVEASRRRVIRVKVEKRR